MRYRDRKQKLRCGSISKEEKNTNRFFGSVSIKVDSFKDEGTVLRIRILDLSLNKTKDRVQD
jgi:hypothetical protein